MAKKQEVKRNIAIENARMVFRNFTGKQGRFNPEGRRNFCVLLEAPIAKDLEADGWNVRYLTPRDLEEEPQAYLQVSVVYSHFPPKVVAINSVGKTILDEDSVHILDWAEIIQTDMIIRPYNWEMNNKSGVKAYLKSMYVTIAEDEFEAKYRNVPDSASAYIDDPEEPPF